MTLRALTGPKTLRRLLALLALCFLIRCSGAEAEPATIAGDPPITPPPPGTPEVQFVLPPDGAELSAWFTLSVLVNSGEVDRVVFEVDDVVVATEENAPYEWTFESDAYETGQHRLGAEAQFGDQVLPQHVTIQVVRPAPPPASVEETLAAMTALPGGHWLEIPSSRMDSAKPNPLPDGWSGFGAIMGAWSGGVFDAKRERLLVWGGGHADYAGNEIYAFTLETLQWSRLTEPSAFPPDDPENSSDKGAHPDGAPISRHSYDYLAYVPGDSDYFFVGGGHGIWRSGQFPDDTTYLFDLGTRKWSQKAKCPVASISAICGVDANGHVWQHSAGGGSRLAEYDPAKDQWTNHVEFGWLEYGYGGVIHPKRNWFLAVGNGETRVWDLDNPDTASQAMQTSGDTGIENANYPGLAYHPTTETIIAWSGGSSVYQLDAGTGKWTRILALNQVSPGSAAGNGTNGRFRYMPNKDLFIVVNAVDKNVFVYRLKSD